MSEKPSAETTIPDGCWYRYHRGDTVLEFGRTCVTVGRHGARLCMSHRVADLDPRWVFVLPKVPEYEVLP